MFSANVPLKTGMIALGGAARPVQPFSAKLVFKARTWHIKDSQGRILAWVFTQKPLKRCKVFPFRPAAAAGPVLPIRAELAVEVREREIYTHTHTHRERERERERALNEPHTPDCERHTQVDFCLQLTPEST